MHESGIMARSITAMRNKLGVLPLGVTSKMFRWLNGLVILRRLNETVRNLEDVPIEVA